ncbi:MAG: hypothetical protein AB8G99_06870 [Planctomycetaceae bacterium]
MSRSIAATNEVFHTRAQLKAMPWQLWVVSVLLGIEGLGNFVSMFDHPIAAFWLTAKIFFIVGFVKRWKAAYIAFLIVGGLHVLAFCLAGSLGIALMNLVLVLLAYSQRRRFVSRGPFGPNQAPVQPE